MKKEIPWDVVREDLYLNHNHSWYDEVYSRNKDNLEKTALVFRGNTAYTYGEFFQLVDRYARALKSYGVREGDEFVACFRLTPVFPVLFAAASLINAKVNLAAPFFCEDFFCEVVNSTGSSIVLITDWDFAALAPALKRCTADKTIVILPVDKWDKSPNPYQSVIDRYSPFDPDAFHEAAAVFSNVIYEDEFLDHAALYSGLLNGHGALEDEIAITYTSGTTKVGWHKAVAQRNETYIIMGRYHDPEVCGIPKMDKTYTLSGVGPHADTCLMTCISDPLMQSGIIALDPIVSDEYFLSSLIINRPGLVVATTSYWLRAMKDTYSDPQYRNLTLPYLYVPSAGGEGMSAGEERALNQWLKHVRAGTGITHTPFCITRMSLGGGDSEHGSLYLRLFREYYVPIQRLRGIREPMGMACYKFAETAALRPDGTYCEPMEPGRLVANSPTAMKGYRNAPEATKEYFITDAYGKTWGDLHVYGYIDRWGNVYMKGRCAADMPATKTFEVADTILEDSTSVMSCEVVTVNTGKGLAYVAHIEPQMPGPVNEASMIRSACSRCRKRFGSAFVSKLFMRIHSNEEGFITTATAKRSLTALKDEGLTKARPAE